MPDIFQLRDLSLGLFLHVGYVVLSLHFAVDLFDFVGSRWRPLQTFAVEC